MKTFKPLYLSQTPVTSHMLTPVPVQSVIELQAPILKTRNTFLVALVTFSKEGLFRTGVNIDL